jgi:hypothetical protein
MNRVIFLFLFSIPQTVGYTLRLTVHEYAFIFSSFFNAGTAVIRISNVETEGSVVFQACTSE